MSPPCSGWSRAGLLALPLALAAAGCGDDPPAAPASAGSTRPDEPLDAEASARLGQAVEAMRGRRWEEVPPLLQPLLDRPSPPADAAWIAGSACFELGRYPEAIALLDEAVRRKPELLPNASALGFAQREIGDFAGARATFEAIVAARPTAHKAHYGLGLVALDEGRLEDARRELEAALTIDPRYLKAQAALGRLLLDEGRHAEARDQLQRVTERWPGNEQALYLLAQAQSALGDQPAADATLAWRAEVYRIKEQIGGLAVRRRTGSASAADYALEVELQLQLGDKGEAARTLALGLRAHPGAPELAGLAPGKPDSAPDDLEPDEVPPDALQR